MIGWTLRLVRGIGVALALATCISGTVHAMDASTLQELTEIAKGKAEPEIVRGQAAYRAATAYLTEQAFLDPQQGVAMMELADFYNHTDAGFMLARIYLNGSFGVPKDTDKAVSLLRSASERGNPDADYALAEAYLFGLKIDGEMIIAKDEAKALDLLKGAVLRWGCHPGANILLAKMHLNGIQTKVDKKAAIWQFESAAGNGSTDAFGYLHKLYDEDAEARSIIDQQNKAFLDRHSQKKWQFESYSFRLGLRSLIGLGLPKDLQLASSYWTAEANQKSFSAPTAYMLAWVYLAQIGQKFVAKGTSLLGELDSFVKTENFPYRPLAYHHGVSTLRKELAGQGTNP